MSDLGVVALVIFRDRLTLQIADQRPLLEHLVGVPGLGSWLQSMVVELPLVGHILLIFMVIIWLMMVNNG